MARIVSTAESHLATETLAVGSKTPSGFSRRTRAAGAEHLLARTLVRPGSIVPSNLYFTTSREHVELAGG
jgi:hypothetical protein